MTEQVVKKQLPLALIVWGVVALVIIVGVTWATVTGAFTWSMAVDAKEAASGFVAGNPVLAYAIYISLFVMMALALFPAQLWIIVFGAMLFGFWPALIVSWAATVLSSVAVFIAARGVLAGAYREKTRRYLARVEQAFSQNQLSWMLTFRFIPVIPYFVSNVAPAFLGGRLPLFALAAAIGVIPYVAAYTFAGAKAAELLDRDTPPDVSSLAADMFPIMLAVAALPLVAMGVRRVLRKKPAA